MKDRFLAIISKGLLPDDLRRLQDLCDESFEKDPVLCGTLQFVAGWLIEEFGEQALPTPRYERIKDTLQKPLEVLIQTGGDSPDTLTHLRDILTGIHTLGKE